MDGLVRQIENYIVKNVINVQNFCSFWGTISQINALALQNFCCSYFQEHVKEIIATQNFLSLSKEIITRIFNMDKLNNHSPIPIQYKTLALTRWFAANNPKQLKRKLESLDNINPLKKRRLNIEKREAC